MAHDIIGDWEVALTGKGEAAPIGRLRFFEKDGRLLVTDPDPEAGGEISRVEVAGDVVRFEQSGGGSSRGTARYTFEVSLRGHGVLEGTRRRGMLARVPIAGQRVIDPMDTIAGNLSEARAKAEEAAERAALAAAEAAAALAEAEAAAALELARQAAQKAVAARAAAAGGAAAPSLVVPREVLAIIPAPGGAAAAHDVPAPEAAAS